MKKCLRFLWKIVVVLLIVIAVLLAFVLCGGLGPTVKVAAPTIAKMMGAEVSLEKCVILPLGGYVRIEGLRVENPKTFREQNAKVYADTPLAKVGKLEIDFAMRSLFTNVYTVDNLELSGVRALYAYDYETTNVDALMAQLDLPAKTEAPAEAVAAEPAPEAAPATTEPAQQKPAPDVVLARVRLEDNSVTVRKFISIPFALPPVSLDNTDTRTLKQKTLDLLAPIGSAMNGVGDALGSATDTIGQGLTKTGDVLNNGLGKTTEALGSGLDTSADALKDSVKALGDSAEGAVKNLKGLFKK